MGSLQDLVRDPGQRPPDLLGVEDCEPSPGLRASCSTHQTAPFPASLDGSLKGFFGNSTAMAGSSGGATWRVGEGRPAAPLPLESPGGSSGGPREAGPGPPWDPPVGLSGGGGGP